MTGPIGSQIGYGDGSNSDAIGTLNSGGGSGGLTLNAFVCNWAGFGGPNQPADLVLIMTGNTAAPAQSTFNSVAFTDRLGNPVLLHSSGAFSWPGAGGVTFTFTQTGNTSVWQWAFDSLPQTPCFQNGQNYDAPVT